MDPVTSNSATARVPVKLHGGGRAYIEATVLKANPDKASGGMPLVEISSMDDVMASIEDIASSLKKSLAKVKPKKATVELGLEVGLEAGKLTALIAKGSAKANFKITLEWD